VLSEAGARKVETALVELDSCRQQAQVMGQQVLNCEQQAKLNSALQEQQSGTIAKLEAALADKEQILARSEEAHRAELKAARGTWRGRFFRAVEIFAGGFIAGVLVR
jgi:multidrug efflux pump subunit AcrA (membrane-fusion protein)